MAKSNQIFIDYERFKLGLYALDDTTKAPFGSARTMTNMRVTDRGGISPRLGTELLGTFNNGATGVRGLYNFRKAFDEHEYLMKAYDDELEFYSKNHSAAGWTRLKNGFTADKEFGFTSSLVNTDNEDYVVFCNRYEPYQRWRGSVTLLNGALAGGETEIIVDNTLTEEIFEAKTATGNAATTLTVATATWASSQWVNLYVKITSGAMSGKVRKITANNATVITFDTLGGAPGNCTFEIRKLAFPATGSIIYNGTVIAYTGIDTATSFTVASAHSSADNVAVALVPTEYPENPRGNRFTNYLSRIVVGNVRSALARDSGGSLQGFSSGGSYFVSKIVNPVDFGFSATRLAGEGDIVGTPYGGGEITDVAHQENTAYIFKKQYIESVEYSQDQNDLANRTPLKSGVGSVGPVIKGSDDIYFVTEDKKLTSIGRVKSVDVLPQTDNIGFRIKRLLDTYVFGTGRGIEANDVLYIPAVSNSNDADNDITIIYNKTNKAFDGIWDLHANWYERFNGHIYFGESNTPNVYQINTGHADVVGTERYPISSQYASHFLNLTGSHANSQALSSLYFEGYIKGNTTITFKTWKDFSNNPLISFDFSGIEQGLLDGQELPGFLGGSPIGLRPMGSVGEVDEEGRRHFFFTVYFPFQYGNHFSVGFESSGVDFDYEVTRFGLGIAESVTVDTARIKSI